jgi:predicted alpha/beta hydrolase family esterase
MRVIILPGMGCTPAASSNWYQWFADEMSKRPIVTECVLRDFPEPHRCRESKWIPFVHNDIGLSDDNASDTILVGHSTGAACAMRLLEEYGEKETKNNHCRLKGVILVATAYTDLGDEGERASEYFSRPWDWDAMNRGAKNIVCFHSRDDPLIPVKEARHVAQQLEGDNFVYHEMKKKSHFFRPWQDILDVMDNTFGASINQKET